MDPICPCCTLEKRKEKKRYQFLNLVVQDIYKFWSEYILMPKDVLGRHTVWFKVFILELWLLQIVLIFACKYIYHFKPFS